MDFSEIKKTLVSFKENPKLVESEVTENEMTLQEIIKIERRHLYGIDSTSTAKRRKAIRELLEEQFKNKGAPE